MKTYCVGARIKPGCGLEHMQMTLNALGKSFKYGPDSGRLSGHCKWDAKAYKEGEDLIISLFCQAEEEVDGN